MDPNRDKPRGLSPSIAPFTLFCNSAQTQPACTDTPTACISAMSHGEFSHCAILNEAPRRVPAFAVAPKALLNNELRLFVGRQEKPIVFLVSRPDCPSAGPADHQPAPTARPLRSAEPRLRAASIPMAPPTAAARLKSTVPRSGFSSSRWAIRNALSSSRRSICSIISISLSSVRKLRTTPASRTARTSVGGRGSVRAGSGRGSSNGERGRQHRAAPAPAERRSRVSWPVVAAL